MFDVHEIIIGQFSQSAIISYNNDGETEWQTNLEMKFISELQQSYAQLVQLWVGGVQLFVSKFVIVLSSLFLDRFQENVYTIYVLTISKLIWEI